MQLGMAIPPEEMARRQAAGPGIKDVLWAVGQKATGKRPRQQCSQPVDADELRKRLYMVLSQQERQKERKLLAMIEEATQRAAEEEEEEAAAAAAAAAARRQSASRSWKPTVVRGTSVKAPESLGMIRDSMRKSSEDPSTSSSRRTTQETQRTRAGSNNSNNRTVAGVGSEQKQQSPAPYVPQEAALQFARTATPMQAKVGKDRKIHELSHEALRVHTEGPALDSSKTLAGARALRKVQSEREKLRSRNQFQNSGAIEETRADDTISSRQQPPATQRYTIPNESTANKRFSLRWSLQHHDLLHPVKTGESDELARQDSQAAAAAHEHRMVDWTQSDETDDKRRGLRSPLLKRADSLWGLKDKLGKLGHEQPREHHHHNTSSDLAERVDAIVPKPVKRGIWTKFRRHAAAIHAA
ncbi:hypothetical protein PFICI_08908 [Pestalotiopsis fici W106-1]|uniref:Uncharacterized protein n=1 Tax=Pestalotiopsis fici (strain W106-1 / CGMCC3.15140) TaxID=1229662 RepID=W3WYX1_PESFW|nr:uncharacterized protein PFICI_08908 [Pestalotiopsis fici W106-1]ETS79055.1 hypothetical protein PFICI_08908 [Pestalotiopsis fici W106-1]